MRRLLPDASDKALDLLLKLLEVDPCKRLSAAAALEHPYLAWIKHDAPEVGRHRKEREGRGVSGWGWERPEDPP